MYLRVLALSALILAVLVAPASAQDKRYVTDKLMVTVRSGPSVENKILHRLISGDVVEIIERQDGGWVKIRLNSGKEGWMIERYLQEEPPAALLIKDLSPQNQDLIGKVEELTDESSRLKTALSQSETRSAELLANYEKLQRESADTMRMKAQHERVQAQFKEQQEKLNELSTEAESLRFGTNLKWFLAGAGVLVVGWIMGWALGRRKNRKSFNLY